MPNQGRPPRGVSANPGKKKSGGMLSGMLGGMLGGGVSGGGYTPEIPAVPDFAPSSYDAAVQGTNNAVGGSVPQGVQGTPVGFKPYTVQNPMIDQIFNRGASSQQAMNLNAQQNIFQAQNDAAKAMQDAQAKSAMEREVYSQDAMTNRIPIQGEDTRKTLGFGNDLALASKEGVDSGNMQRLFGVTATPRISTAGNIAQYRASNSATPDFANLVSNAQNAEQVMPVAQVQRISDVTLPQNTSVYQQDYGMGYGNKMMTGPMQNQSTEQIGAFPIKGPDGKTIMVGGQTKIVNKDTPAKVTDLDAQEQAEHDAVMKNLNAQNKFVGPPVSGMGGSMPPQQTSVSATPNTAMIPQMGRSINQNLLSPYFQAMKSLLYDAPYKKLIDSSHQDPYQYLQYRQ